MLCSYSLRASANPEELEPVTNPLGNGKSCPTVAGQRAGIQKLAGSSTLATHRPQIAPGDIEHLDPLSKLIAHPDPPIRGRDHPRRSGEIALADLVRSEAAHPLAGRAEDLHHDRRGAAHDDESAVGKR